MVNSSLQRNFALEERQKYTDMFASSSGAYRPVPRPPNGSLFGALQRSSLFSRLPFTTKNPINIGSRNKYGKLLEKFSASIDNRPGAKTFRHNVSNTVKPSACVDLTTNTHNERQRDTPVELTDDDDEEEDCQEVIDLEDAYGNNDGSFKIPKSFPCAASLDNPPPRSARVWKSPPQSPRSILMALEQVVVDDDDDDEDDVSIVLDYDDQASTSSSRRKKQSPDPVEPVNSLLDEWQSKPVFKDDWLAETRRRYSEKQQKWSAKIAEEQMLQEAMQRESRQDVQEMIKKMDEALLLGEVIIVEDEEALAAAAALEAQKQVDTPLPSFTEDQVNLIRYAGGRGNPDEVLITKFSTSIRRRDVATLLGDSWLNDEVINFYMNLLMERSEEEGRLKVYAMNTFFMPKVLQQGQSGVRRWTRKVDLFSYDVIPVPVHVSGIHWCMAIIHLRDKYIRYYDSMGQPNKRVLEALAVYLKDESKDKKKVEFAMDDWVKESVPDCPRQMNGSDCGVFSCMFAGYITRGHRINFTQENMPYFRQKMILEICSGKLLL